MTDPLEEARREGINIGINSTVSEIAAAFGIDSDDIRGWPTNRREILIDMLRARMRRRC